MTPEERAELILSRYHKDCAPIWDDLKREIAAAIRDAVAEAEFRYSVAAKAHDDLLEGGAKARAALEPFARLADSYRDVADRRFNLEGDAPNISSDQLRAARDAYLALGGKLLDS